MQTPMTSYVIVNNLGGITSLVENLIRYRGPEALPQEMVVLDIAGNVNSPIVLRQTDDLRVKRFSLHPRHNWYVIYRQLADVLSDSGGVLVSNYVYDLLMLTHFNIPKKVVQIVHDAYNVKLSIQYEEVVDRFICHSLFYYETLCQLLHHRREDIFHIPYGIPLSQAVRTSRLHDGPLNLLFLGRHDNNKGIFDLYEIHCLLRELGIPVNWLILGKGPGTEQLKQQWQHEKNVRFLTPDTNEEVLQLVAGCDIFVFPTKFEGFPVALVEAMSVGCIPVATDLPGGLRELVKDGVNGYLCKIDDNKAFAERIAFLHNNRVALERMSEEAFRVVASEFNASIQAPEYQSVFNALASSPGAPRHHSVKRKLGSRLDQPWLPDILTVWLRKLT